LKVQREEKNLPLSQQKKLVIEMGGGDCFIWGEERTRKKGLYLRGVR